MKNIFPAAQHSWISSKLRPVIILGSLSVTLLCAPLYARQEPQDSTTPNSQAPAADNTKRNLPANDKDASRADQQSNVVGDRELTRSIRKSIVGDKNLSTYAHNVKIITHSGIVTLKGPVRSQEEKESIAAKAKEIAGDTKVKDELTIKSDDKK